VRVHATRRVHQRRLPGWVDPERLGQGVVADFGCGQAKLPGRMRDVAAVEAAVLRGSVVAVALGEPGLE